MDSVQLNIALSGVRARYTGKQFIGVCGSAEDEQLDLAEHFLNQVLSEIDSDCVVVCGGTRGGVPELVTRMCFARDIPVIGIAPTRGEKKLLDELTHSFCVNPTFGSSAWGDESSVLVKLCDAMLFLGGGWGTMIEFSHAMKINSSRIAHTKQPIALAVILWFGGVMSHAYQQLPHAPHILHVMHREISAQDVAQFLDVHTSFTIPQTSE
ncbi:MAG: hypothetical protein CMI52_01010 [Parcubacteria group bacterium]|nr:hypothetical protein [Parcubacteria group bacterium]